MPIVEVEVVCRAESDFRRFSPMALADALGRIFGSRPGTAWVKLRFLSASRYAENEATLGSGELPAFVSVLHARVPDEETLAAEAKAVTEAVASWVGRPSERVHVRYEPPAAGRQAFGGNLVR